MLGDEVDAKPALAEILDGGSEVIDCIVNDEEAIVRTLELMDVDE